MMSASRYRIEERAEVMRVYEIVATSGNKAIKMMFSGKIQPIELYDVDSTITIKKISARKAKDE